MTKQNSTNKGLIQEVLKTPLTSYKLNNKLKSAVIPRAHLAVLNTIATGIKPNGLFDWGKSIWNAAKEHIPGLHHVEDLVGHVKKGVNWVKDFWKEPSIDKAIEGGKALYEHGKKNIKKLKDLKEGDLTQLGPDVVSKTTSMLKSRAKFKTSGIHPNLALLKEVQGDVIITKPNPLDLPPVVEQNENHRIKSTNKYTSLTHQPFASSVIIMDISPATYTTGQILATFPLTANNLFDEETAQLASSKELVAYHKIVGKVDSYSNSAIGGSFGAFFDPDPQASWLVGSTGITNLQRARDEVGFKNEETFKSFEAKCPLIPLKDEYWLNPANSNGRNFLPGTFVVMCVSNTTITSGNDLQVELNCEGEFISTNDTYSSSTLASTIVSRSSTLLPVLPSGGPLLNAAFFGNLSSNNYDLFNTNNTVPMCSAATPTQSTQCVWSPGVYDYDIDVDTGSTITTPVLPSATTNDATSVFSVCSWLNGPSAGLTGSARSGTYVSPVAGAPTLTSTNTGFQLRGRFTVGNNSIGGSATSPMVGGFVQSIPTPATYGPYSAGSGTVSSLGVDTSQGGVFDLLFSPSISILRLSVRVNKLYESVNPYGGTVSIRNNGNLQLQKSILMNHANAIDAVDRDGKFIHIPQHCTVCKHHHHEIDIKIEDNEDCKSDFSYEDAKQSLPGTEEHSKQRILDQIDVYTKVLERLKKQTTWGGEGPTNKQMHSLNGNIKPNKKTNLLGITNQEEYNKFLSNGNHDINHKIKPKSKNAEEQLRIMKEKLMKLRVAHTSLLNQTNQLLSNVCQTKIKPKARNVSNKPINHKL